VKKKKRLSGAAKGWGKGISSKALDRKKKEMPKDGAKGRAWIKEEIRVYELRDGNNYLRPIQPLEVEELNYYGMEVYVHGGVGRLNANYVCMLKTFTEACARCERQTGLWEEDFDIAKTLYPRKRVLMWVLDLLADDEDAEEPQLFNCPKSVAGNFLKQSEKKRKGVATGVYTDPSHPTKGHCLTFDYAPRKGQEPGKYTNEGIESDLAPKLDIGLRDKIIPLKDCLVLHDYDELKELDAGGAAEEAEEDEYDDMNRKQLKKHITDKKLDIRVHKGLSDDDIRAAIREEEGEEEPEEEGLPDFDSMSRRELKQYIVQEDLDIKVLKKMTEDDLRDKIREEVEEEEEEEEEEGEDDEGIDKKRETIKQKLERLKKDRKQGKK